MLKLKLPYLGHLMLGKNEGKRRRGQQRTTDACPHHQLSGHEFEQAQGNGDDGVLPGIISLPGSQEDWLQSL